MSDGGTTEAVWKVERLRLRLDVVVSIAINSLRLRVTRSVLTMLTIATSAAFMMYLLTAPRAAGAGERQSWTLLMGMSLVVSAAGVLNTMLMAVSQRYREIGTMKCLGALDQFVLLSVMIEAGLLGLAGAAGGIVAGLAVSVGLAAADHGAQFASHLSLASLGLKLLFVFLTSLALAMLGAAAPAWIASRMPPMDAMRGEK